LRRVVPERAPCWSARDDRTYLVTGGASGIGLEASRWLVARGAKHLAIVGRRQEEDAATAVDERERAGASVRFAPVDVGEPGAVRRYVERERESGLPPIGGIVHCAAVVHDALVVTQSTSTIDDALWAKAFGAWETCEAVANEPVERAIFYSSVTAVLGQFGQSAYGAASAFVDALARSMRRDGRHAVSVNWGPWADVGYWARAKARTRADLDAVRELTRDEGADALAYALATGRSQLVVVEADRSRAAETPLLSELREVRNGQATGDQSTSEAGLVGLEMLLTASEERRPMIARYLVDRVASILRCDPSRIATTRPLTAMGMDSLMAVELRNRIERDLGIRVPIVDLFTATVDQLVDRLDAHFESGERLALLMDDERFANLLSEIEDEGVDPGMVETRRSSGDDLHGE
jgi:NAD(P)-dependent dehydrogenase (short-subunit alcohol dehydrogenase family)/acyl carrier protein